MQIRWHRAKESIVFNPRARHQQSEQEGKNGGLLANGRWNGTTKLPYVGETNRSFGLDHDDLRSNLSAQFVPKENPSANFEVGVQRNRARTDVFYAMNNSFTVANSAGVTTLGDGGSSSGAVLIKVTGDIAAKFEVLVDDRIAGYVWAGTPNVISLQPYETYNVQIRPVGAKFVGFDDRVQSVTIYPGNVEPLEFVVRELTVLVGHASFADGRVVANARFRNVEGYGSTDAQGWFQVELSHREPLILEDKLGRECLIELPELVVQEGLAVAENLVCEEPIQAQP